MPDWTFVGKFGEEVAKRAGVSNDDVWASMLGGSQLTVSGGQWEYKFTEEDQYKFHEYLWKWILQHPYVVGMLMACIAAGPTALIAVPPVVCKLGFGSLGPVAGSYAAAAQSVIGPIASRSAFAILQSAGMGGYGLREG